MNSDQTPVRLPPTEPTRIEHPQPSAFLSSPGSATLLSMFPEECETRFGNVYSNQR